MFGIRILNFADFPDHIGNALLVSGPRCVLINLIKSALLGRGKIAVMHVHKP